MTLSVRRLDSIVNLQHLLIPLRSAEKTLHCFFFQVPWSLHVTPARRPLKHFDTLMISLNFPDVTSASIPPSRHDSRKEGNMLLLWLPNLPQNTHKHAHTRHPQHCQFGKTRHSTLQRQPARQQPYRTHMPSLRLLASIQHCHNRLTQNVTHRKSARDLKLAVQFRNMERVFTNSPHQQSEVKVKLACLKASPCWKGLVEEGAVDEVAVVTTGPWVLLGMDLRPLDTELELVPWLVDFLLLPSELLPSEEPPSLELELERDGTSWKLALVKRPPLSSSRFWVEEMEETLPPLLLL